MHRFGSPEFAGEEASASEALLRCDGVSMRFGGRWLSRGTSKAAVDGLGITIRRGHRLGIFGRRGAGKTVFARLLLGWLVPSEGRLWLGGRVVPRSPRRALDRLGRVVQPVIGEARGFLNPAQKACRIVGGALRGRSALSPEAERDRVRDLCHVVGLDPRAQERRPAELTNAECLQVMLARALAAEPGLLVLDEPFCLIDTVERAELVQRLHDLQQNLGLSFVLLTRDPVLVAASCDEAAVMHAGRVVEHADAERLFSRPLHDHSRRLLQAIPIDPRFQDVPLDPFST